MIIIILKYAHHLQAWHCKNLLEETKIVLYTTYKYTVFDQLFYWRWAGCADRFAWRLPVQTLWLSSLLPYRQTGREQSPAQLGKFINLLWLQSGLLSCQCLRPLCSGQQPHRLGGITPASHTKQYIGNVYRNVDKEKLYLKQKQS